MVISEAQPTAAEKPKVRRFLKISLLVGFLVLLNYGGSLVVEQINFQLWPEHENLMIAVALNLPGNVLIGGGGGIGLISGMSNLCPFPKYILFVDLAITPLPILFLLGTLPKLFAGREIDNLSILIYTV
jgi:hypothetical protein